MLIKIFERSSKCVAKIFDDPQAEFVLAVGALSRAHKVIQGDFVSVDNKHIESCSCLCINESAFHPTIICTTLTFSGQPIHFTQCPLIFHFVVSLVIIVLIDSCSYTSQDLISFLGWIA